MSLKALNPFAPAWYTPVGQDDDKIKTRFQLTGLDGIQQAELQPEITLPETDDDDLIVSPRGHALLLRHGLLAWEHFDDAAGPVAFADPETNQAKMPLALQTELATQIFIHTFTPAETKKK